MKGKLITLLAMAVVAVTLAVVLVSVVGNPFDDNSVARRPETAPSATQAATSGVNPADAQQSTQSETAAETSSESSSSGKFMLDNVKVIPQTTLKAGCETYACTMLLNMLGYDIDEITFADNYLITSPVYYGDDGQTYGPDMHSAFAGSAYAGWGVYAPAMAKSMNGYLSQTGTSKRATAYEDIPLETLCDEYVSKGVPVMVWATTGMSETYAHSTWIVSYVDENAKAEIGDEVSWYAHEHCLVLIGYDEDNYYFADSAAGEISCFDKKVTDDRYHDIGCQCIIVE